MRTAFNWLIFVLGLAVFVLECSGQDASTAQREPELFSLTISTDQSTIKAGEEIRLRVVLTNTSDHELYLRKDKAPNRGEFNYIVEMHDEKGKRLHETKYHRALKGEDGDPTTVIVDSGGPVPIQPGKTLEDEIVLNKLFDLSQPGKYTVDVRRRYESDKSSVKSNTLTISVTP